MKTLLLLGIELYWRLTPEHRRRSCVFRESCSLHVYRIAKDKGARAGISALWQRAQRCRGVRLENTPEGVVLRLRDGSLLSEEEASETILRPWKLAHQLEECLPANGSAVAAKATSRATGSPAMSDHGAAQVGLAEGDQGAAAGRALSRRFFESN